LAGILIILLLLTPALSAALCLWPGTSGARRAALAACGIIVPASALLLVGQPSGPVAPAAQWARSLNMALALTDMLTIGLIAAIGIRRRHRGVTVLALLQFGLWALFEHLAATTADDAAFFVLDHLSLLMVVIVSVIGPLILLYATAYMARHHAPADGASPARQQRFFAVLLLFIGAMNALVLTDNRLHLMVFFELTTLCSYLLIRHDGSPTAERHALRALWLNALAGVALTAGALLLYRLDGSLALHTLRRLPPAGHGWRDLALALMCCAAFIKSAQLPFQSWLLGAMVAPTPVSALLHSSTMVKAGVYLVLRLMPALDASGLGQPLALYGAYTFLAAAALAVGQRNGKAILAYSTVSNLGLILACAGLGTPAALTGALLLVICHAISKALLFLCVGRIEQQLASRDIETMRGVYAEMPLTSLITVIGVITMILPPFGMIAGKWIAMEAAAGKVLVSVLLAIGSAVTLVYWARWAGMLMSAPPASHWRSERLPRGQFCPLLVLCLASLLVSAAAPWVLSGLARWSRLPGQPPAQTVARPELLTDFGTEMLFVVAGLGLAWGVLLTVRAWHRPASRPYLSGLETDTAGFFRGAQDRELAAVVENYYLPALFGERRLTLWGNAGALALLALLMGRTL
jgi:ech hydrogenase subunit A